MNNLAKLFRFAVIPAMLTSCKALPPEPPPTLLPKYQLSSVLLVEDLRSPGFGDYPVRLDAALVEALKACAIDVHSYVSREAPTLTLSEKDENVEAVAAKLREFKPQTLIAVESPSQHVVNSFLHHGISVTDARIKVVVKDLKSNAIIRTIDFGTLDHNLSGNFGSLRGGLRWLILHNLHRDGLLPCDPGPTDGDWVDHGL